MKEKDIFMKNYKLVMAFILGLIVASGGVYAATTVAGSNVTYSNTKSGLSSTNVQGAIDELYEQSDIRKAGKFVSAYTYNETGSNKCITGEESTCKKTTCYKTKTANSCPAGTIIKYKVNDTDIVNFHVMFDNGSTMTMQSQKNTIYNTAWHESSNDNTKGPITILPALENATRGWSNVNNQTYTLGTTNLSGKGAYTGCSKYDTCTANNYTLPERTAKARMITMQEAEALGCTFFANSCKKFMVANGEEFYWMSSADSVSSSLGWALNSFGLTNTYVHYTGGSRAVVEVSK